MVVHAKNPDGSAKCGCNVYYHYDYDAEGKVVGKTKKVGSRYYLYFAKEGEKPTCKRCLNEVARPEVVAVPDNWSTLVFHYSFGYDMTFNVYAKPVRKTTKGVVCVECNTNVVAGDPNGYRGDGRAVAGDVKTDEKPFFMTLKKSKYGSEYWAGNGKNWSVWDGQPNYENRCD